MLFHKKKLFDENIIKNIYKKDRFVRYVQFLVGSLLVALAFNLFILPNQITYGMSGIGVILNSLFGLDPSMVILIGSGILLVMSYFLLGKEKTMNSILGSIVVPILMKITEFVPEYIVIETTDPFVLVLFGAVITGFGMGLVFKAGYTTGGTDILEQLLVKYAKMPFSKAIIYIDGAIIVLSGLVYGMETLLYSLIVLILSSELTHRTMFKINRHQLLFVQSKKINKIKEYLQTQYAYDVTLLNTIGGYTQKKRKTLFCAVEKKDYYPIKEGILLIDPHAFITFVKAYETQNGNHTLRHNQEKLTLDEDKC